MTYYRWNGVLSAVVILCILMGPFFLVHNYLTGNPLPPNADEYVAYGITRWWDIVLLPLAAMPIFWLLGSDAEPRGVQDIADILTGIVMLPYYLVMAAFIGPSVYLLGIAWYEGHILTILPYELTAFAFFVAIRHFWLRSRS